MCVNIYTYAAKGGHSKRWSSMIIDFRSQNTRHHCSDVVKIASSHIIGPAVKAYRDDYSYITVFR